MYMVVSRWKPNAEAAADFKGKGKQARQKLRSMPGVKFVEAIEAGGENIVVHAYENEEAYKNAVHNPQSEFAKEVEASGLEKAAQWLGSEKGVTLDT